MSKPHLYLYNDAIEKAEKLSITPDGFVRHWLIPVMAYRITDDFEDAVQYPDSEVVTVMGHEHLSGIRT